VLSCPACAQENRSDARFCNSCGRALEVAAGSAREARKTVSVVFCDVVGSTELGERHDPEVLRGMMARFYAAVRVPVERYGGTVEKVIGDALVAVFGIPVVHEDDALRAVRAAVEMRDAVREMGELEARIGVNTGDVLARDPRDGESLVVGDAVNIAARLEQSAGAGEVLVGDATWSLVLHAVRGERVASVSAKGKSEPLAAWRLESVDPLAFGHRRRLELPMIGRDQELGLLRWALERTEQTARPHLVTVLGVPGIGKSRLVAEVPRLRDGLRVVTGQCRAIAGASSLEPMLEILRAAAAIDEGDVLAGPDADAVDEVLQRPQGAGAADIAWAASRLLGVLAAQSTLVAVFEDVHWADDLLLDSIAQLAGRGRGRALVVICTTRPELAERRPGWGAGANTVTVALEPLDNDQTLDLLRHAGPALEPGEARRVAEVAEGNPLFAEHLSALVTDDETTATLPRSIGVLLAARLESLPEPEREVLGAAAVVGRDFSLAGVEALIGREVAPDLEHAGRRELVEPAGEDEYRFAHALLQEAAYGLLPKARRAELHLELARWLDGQHAGDAVVGAHLERAHRLRAELGSADAALGEEAGMRLIEAGRRADARGDPARARDLLERALQLLPEGSAGRASATIELAAAGWNILDRTDVTRLLDDGVALASGAGMRALAIRGRILRLGAPEGTVADAQKLAETTAALAELEHLDDPRAMATVLSTKAAAECGLGRAADGLASAQRALQILRDIDQDTVWAIEVLIWAAVNSPVPVSEAEALLAGLMDELGLRPTVRVGLLTGRAMLAALRGDDEAADRLHDQWTAIERDLARRPAWEVAGIEALMRFRQGRYRDAAGLLRTYLAGLTEAGHAVAAGDDQGLLALCEGRCGLSTQARDRARQVLAEPDAGYEASTLALLALCEAALVDGEPAAAVDHGTRALEVAASGDWVPMIVDSRRSLARALLAAGDRSLAEEQTRRAQEQARVKQLA
jgi:class 3 adenylate cyclase